MANNTTPLSGEECKRLRTERKLTQKQLADQAGVKSVATIVNFEKGHCTPRTTTVASIRKVLCPTC
jgi:transcriptional regulator with XRE-family HTH domain